MYRNRKFVAALVLAGSVAFGMGSAWAQALTTTTGLSGTAGVNYIQLNRVTQSANPLIPAPFINTFGVGGTYVSVDQFATTADLNSSISGVNSSLSGVSSSVAGLNTSVAGLNSSVANFSAFVANFSSSMASANASIAGLQAGLANLRNEAFSDAALAAALTPILPTGGNKNHINVASATLSGVQAYSVNYARVEGQFDFVAGAAISRHYGLAKVGMGFSW